MRMRRRRAERCVLRAQVALEAGFPEDARAALDEARRLDSTTPDFESLSAATAIEIAPAITDAPEEFPDRPSGSRLPLIWAGVALTAVLAGIGTFAVSSGARTTPSSLAAASIQSVKAPAPSAQEPSAPVPAPVAVDATPAGHEVSEPPPAAAVKEPSRPASALSTPPPITTPVAAPVAIADSIPTPDVPVAIESKPLESRAPEATPITLAPATPLVLPAANGPSLTLPTAPAPNEPPRVRAVLARYEAGFSALNVAAVQGVWPAVDARSLSRAFDGLQSQRFTLGQCSMAIETASATATCNGTASWTPKIGGGVRSEHRRWVFELRKVDADWQILRVSTR